MALALEGYRMLDMSRLLPGPICSWLLADMGMEVIKIEETGPRGGMGRDVFTPYTPTTDEEIEASAWNPVARNKKSIALNLKDEAAKKVFYELAKTADVVLEGYRPGVTKRLGVDFETLQKINPGIIFCSISGYGQDGPYKLLPGHDANYAAMAGTLMVNTDDNGKPHGMGATVGDSGAAVHAALGITSAILARQKTGKGQYVDTAMTDSLFSFMIMYSRCLQTGNVGGVPRGGLTTLKCKDGKWISTSNAETHFQENFYNAIGKPEYIELAVSRKKGPERDKMIEDVKEVFLTKTRDEWFKILSEAETCVAPAYEMQETFKDPHVLARNMVWEMDHPKVGKVKQMGSPMKLSDTPATFRNFAPLLGENTEELMKELGYSGEDINKLHDSGAIKAWRPDDK